MALAGRIKKEILGVFAIFGGLYVALSLITYDAWDPSVYAYHPGEVTNYGGRIGASMAEVLFTFLGYMAFALPVFILAFGVRRIIGQKGRKLYLIGSILMVLSGSSLILLLQGTFDLPTGSSGLLGDVTGKALIEHMSVPGAYIASLCITLMSIIMLSPVSLIGLFTNAFKRDTKSDTDNAATTVEITEPVLSSVPALGELESSSGLSDIFKAFRDGDKADEPPFDTGAEDMLTLESPIDPVAVSPARRKSRGKFKLPSLDILKYYESEADRSPSELQAGAQLLEARLAEFNVKGSVVHVHAGPVVTLFEFEPAAGVKMNKVIALSDDLALGLRAQSVRISAVPGKATIGIEVPNEKSDIVSLRDMVASENFVRNDSLLSIAMGKDIFGKPVVADLARMPHLLVAGATGAGKSVFINAVIMSFLYKATPDEVKMLMIDPKLLELSVYDGIPHLLAPVVTSPKDASEMLRRMVFEMERRYRVLAGKGVRNIDSFNSVVPDEEKLPFIVVIIDELADLMLSSAAQVEDSIARLAQMARAAGIHLIIATQRPSVDVITGVIKANFPARVAFQVSSGTDSRTIIGGQGAEKLIGRGDMLFMLPGVKMMRVHGALVTEGEVNDAVRHVKALGTPDYSIIDNITQAEDEARAEAEYSEDRDEHFWRAVEFAEVTGEVSISSIQRKLKIGYNRAARIMEIMEGDGMVGSPKGAGKPRDFIGRGRM